MTRWILLVALSLISASALADTVPREWCGSKVRLHCDAACRVNGTPTQKCMADCVQNGVRCADQVAGTPQEGPSQAETDARKAKQCFRLATSECFHRCDHRFASATEKHKALRSQCNSKCQAMGEAKCGG